MTVATSVSLLNSPEVRKALLSIAPEMRRGTARAIIHEAQPIVADARAEAGTWSTRIPGAISVRPTFSGRYVGIYIRVDSKKAPHARAYEGVDGNDKFRHPVYFSDTKRENTWVDQKTRPFIAPAIRAGQPRVRAGIEQAISDALRV